MLNKNNRKKRISFANKCLSAVMWTDIVGATTTQLLTKLQTTRQQPDNCENPINYPVQIVIVNIK